MSDPAAVLEKTGLRFKDPKALEDPEVIRGLAELNAALEANPLEGYNNKELNPRKFHAKQMEFHAIKAPPLGIKALIAGNRSGKTVACVVDDIIQLVPEELLPEHLKGFKKFDGPVKIWVGAPKNDTHFKNTIPLFRKFLPKAALKEGQFGKSFRRQPAPEIELVNGSTVSFKTYDQDLDAWAAAEVHRIHWDEEPNTLNSRELRTEANSRLVSVDGDEIIGMTPLLGMSWVFEEVWEKRDEDPQVAVVQMDVGDNPWNSKESIEKWAARMTDEEKRMRLKGEFVNLGGMFFGEFRPELHVVDEVTPDHIKDQENVVIIDPGMDRTGVIWMAFDKENSALVFEEFNPAETTVPLVAQEIKKRNKAWGIKDPTYVIDPSARNREAINADQIEAAYIREDIYAEHAQNSRPAGILEMKRRFQATDPEGKPSPTLVFARNCQQVIRQVRKYCRDPKAKDEWAAAPQTKTVRWDLVDSTRYGVMSKAWELPEDEPYRPPAFQPNYEPPYNPQHFQSDPAPMGDWS